VRKLASPLIKLVIFAVVTIFATYVLAATIVGRDYGDTRSYKALFTDVTGLNKGDDVRIAGVRVGSISALDVVNHNQARITFSMRAQRTLPTTVIAQLRYRNIVGQRYLALEQGPGDTGSVLRPGATIPVAQTRNALDLTVLFAGFQPLFQGLNAGEINSLSGELIQVLQGEGGTITDLLSHTASLTSTLADSDQIIGDLIDNLDTVLKTVGDRDTQLDSLIVQFQRLLSGLAQDRTTIGDSITGINSLASTTTDFLSQIRPELATDISQLTAVTSNLNGARDTVNGVLQRLPGKLAAVTRTATYGSWFNFYLCSVGGSVELPGNIPLSPQVSSGQARCS
jgi:phospholipid/cholesterol/gamma-HCH transport system substrate-binding protein